MRKARDDPGGWVFDPESTTARPSGPRTPRLMYVTQDHQLHRCQLFNVTHNIPYTHELLYFSYKNDDTNLIVLLLLK